MIVSENRLPLFTIMHGSSSLSARVQAAENAGLFWLLQGDVCKVIGAPGILGDT
jgi:hypothetical protein